MSLVQLNGLDSREESELQLILTSDAFARSPILGRLLRYLGENIVNARRGNLNEYKIGVEALGRPKDFDPAHNSSVRVMMHRLRQRLRDYYETEGIEHEIKVILEDGRYALTFDHHHRDKQSTRPDVSSAIYNNPQARSGEDEPANAPPDVQANLATTDLRSRHPGRLQSVLLTYWMLGSAIIVCVAGIWIFIRMRNEGFSEPKLSTIVDAGVRTSSTPGLAAASGNPVRILAGNVKSPYVDREGRVWDTDRYFSGGDGVETKFPYMLGTHDPRLFQTARIGEFSYSIPVKPGTYQLRLLFAETFFGPGTTMEKGDASRIFFVYLNSGTLLSDFDIDDEAGGNDVALTRVFRDVVPDQDGMVHLRFHREMDQPLVNAIELLPQQQAGAPSLHLVMQDSPYVDANGQLWEADQYVRGGMLGHRKNDVPLASDPHLFDGERYGHFTYHLPVPPGCYTLSLYFAETYFGLPPQNQDTRDVKMDFDARVFDVYSNGRTLLHNFNVLRETGAPNRPAIKTFDKLQPNASGQIVLEFLPIKNYAELNALDLRYRTPSCS